MDGEAVVKKGYLDVLPSSAMDQTYVPLWQKRFYTLIKSSKAGQGRFVYVEEEDDFNKSQNNCLEYYMEQIDEVEIGGFGQQKSCFQIRAKTGNIQNCFRAENEAEAQQWCRLLRENINIYKKNCDRGVAGGPLTKPARSLFREEALSEYQVSIDETDASKRCSISGDNQNYLLRIFTESIDLWTEDNRILYSWPYSTIRRFGGTSVHFTIEVGRKAPTGEGVFTFLTNQSKAIRSDVQAAGQRRRLKGPDPITPPPRDTDIHRGEGDYTSLEAYLTTNFTHRGEGDYTSLETYLTTNFTHRGEGDYTSLETYLTTNFTHRGEGDYTSLETYLTTNFTHRGEGDYTSLETYLTPNVQAQGPMAQAPRAQAPRAQAPRAQGPMAQAPRAQGPRAQGSVYENVTRDKRS